MNEPLVTVVTPSLNQGAFIAETIESVLAQDYPHLEYLIMDGGSTDGTLEILRRYDHDPRLTWISEPDTGMANALNKGFARARGDILTWLNSDDTFIGQPVRATVDYFAAHPEAAVVYGQVIFTDTQNHPLDLPILGAPFDFVETLSDAVSIPQQGAFFTRAVWDRLGGLREEWHYVLDLDLWLRASRVAELHFMSGVRAAYRQHADAKTVAQDAATWQERAKLAQEILADPHTFPEAQPYRRLIASNLAWGLAKATARRGDKKAARRALRQAIRYTPLRLRLAAMLAMYIDLRLGTHWLDYMSAVWRRAKA